jgi:molybdenum-dependent DNA-binding transcriptional regulator ModE
LHTEREGGREQSTAELRERAKRCLKLVERALQQPA